MKTSSSTFEPKQSDMTYWYHTMTGFTVVAPKDTDVEYLNSKIPQELSKDLSNEFFTCWIDLSTNINVPDVQTHDIMLWHYQNTGEERILFQFTIPNPKFFDIDFSKIHVMGNKESDGELSIGTARKCSSLSGGFSDDDDLNAFENSNEENVVCTFFIDLPEDNSNTDNWQFRYAFEYEEDGETHYVYGPTASINCNDLIEAGKVEVLSY